MLLVSCSKDNDEAQQVPVTPTPVPEEPLHEDAEFLLNLGVGSHNLMWTMESGTRSVTRADIPDKLDLRGDLHFYAYADDNTGSVPSIREGITINDYILQTTNPERRTLTTNFSSTSNSGEFYCRKYNDVVGETNKATYLPNHATRYQFFTYNVDNSYTTFDGKDCASIYNDVSPVNIARYIEGVEPLQWANLPKISPFCAWMYSDVARTRVDVDIYKNNNGSYYDGNLILVPGYDEEGKPRYDVYIPFIMHPAMALLRLNYKLSYAYAMQSGGAAHDDVGFREFRIKSVVLNKFPDNDTNVNIVIKKADSKDYASLRSDVPDGTFTEVATIFAAPTTASLTVPMIFTYDVCDRAGNYIRKNETVNASFTINQRLDGGKYYDVNLSIVPSFLYTMSDIDPDSPTGYIIEK